MSSTRPMIVVTAPHARGPTDAAAESVARVLTAKLRATGRVDVELLVGDTSRFECDLNRRRRCDESDFQRRYAAALARRPAFVVDAHSFPDSYRWSLPGDGTVPAVFLFENVTDGYAIDLARAVGIAALPAAPATNALIYWARAAGVDAALLEINEQAWQRSRRDVAVYLDRLVRWLVGR